jgi:hypothetical protein
MRPVRRTTWLVIAAAITVVIVVVAVAAYLAGRSSGSGSTGSSRSAVAAPSASAVPTASSTDDTLGAAPTGCLGGPSRTDAMVLAAQQQAPHTAYGAVEVAAAVFRWAIRSPEPTAADVRGIAPIFTRGKRAAAQQQLIADYNANPNPSGGVVPDGQSFYLTTANGQWLVPSGATADRAAVDVQALFVINGAVSPTKSLTETLNLVWEDGTWHLDGLAKGNAEGLASGGTQFTGGC